MQKKLLAFILVFALVLIMVPMAFAEGADDIEFVSLGYDAPPTELGGYQLFPMEDPGFDELWEVTAIPTFAGDISFVTEEDEYVETRFVTDSWATWSHGYEGLVFRVSSNTVTFVLPKNVKAFVVYAEPDSFDIFNFEVQADDGTVYTEEVEGKSGAKGFGFYATGDAAIMTVKITSGDNEFAFGELALGFGINDVVTLEETGEDLLPSFLARYTDIITNLFDDLDVTDVTLSSPGNEQLLSPGSYEAVVTFMINGIEIESVIAEGLVIKPKQIDNSTSSEPTVSPQPTVSSPPTGDSFPVTAVSLLATSVLVFVVLLLSRKRETI